jgi:hypothetical protein
VKLGNDSIHPSIVTLIIICLNTSVQCAQNKEFVNNTVIIRISLSFGSVQLGMYPQSDSGEW